MLPIHIEDLWEDKAIVDFLWSPYCLVEMKPGQLKR